MFIALICFVKTLLDYSTKKVFRKKWREFDRIACKKPKSKKKYRKRRKKLSKCKNDMLDTATSRRIEEYDGVVISRISDYNSNTYEKDDIRNIQNLDETNLSYVSSIFSQDVDFIQDNSDYQWFAEYGYRGDTSSVCSNNVHTSILSSLCTSYGYNDLARDLDANLAQVDMEDFRTEDIHSFLHGLPQICCTDVHNERGGEMIASVSGSIMGKYDFDSSVSHHSNSQEDSNGSIYKSEILFSPVREVPLVSFSIDSLDCEEHDIMLTCQANKDNYTIAFEGSTLMEKSTDSHLQNNDLTADNKENKQTESVERMSLDTTSSENSNSVNQVDKTFINKSPLICSESPYTTWSKLKEDSVENILKRQSSGNNNTTTFSSTMGYTDLTTSCSFLKSQSLPNLNPTKRPFLLGIKMNRSIRSDRVEEQPSLQRNQFVKIYNLSKSQCGRKIHRSIFQNNLDLISQFISHKHVGNNVYSRSDEGCDSSSVGILNCKYGQMQSENANQSANLAQIKELENRNNDNYDEENDDSRESKGCDIFEDSLVADRFNGDRSEVLALSDSCSSFSSHSGRLELNKKIGNLEGKEISLPSEKFRGANFIRNKYFDSAKQYEKEQKKRKLIKKYVGNVKPIKIMDRSMQTSSSDADSAVSPTGNQKTDSDGTKPVYVMYPNYTLPDLSFLQHHATELDLKNVFLWPQKFSPSPTTEHASVFSQSVERTDEKKKRSCSCPDFESVKNKNYQHIRDWESLMFLLPREYCKILSEDPELKKYAENMEEFGRSLICTSVLNNQDSPLGIEVKTTYASSSSSGTQPSSGYRSSSTMLLTDSGGSPFKYEDQKNYANRPPLPKGILRNPVLQNIKCRKNLMNTKRYSMFELRKDDRKPTEKRRSLPSQFDPSAQKKMADKETSYSEDEGVDSAGSHCDSPGPNSDQDGKKLEFLLENAFHWNEDESVHLRNQTNKKTVSFADRRNQTPPNSPNCSVTAQHKGPYQMKLYSAFDRAIHEECESNKHSSCDHSFDHCPRTSSYNYKKELIDAVEDAVKRIDSTTDNDEMVAHMVLNYLCPALYAILNHGLKPTLETAFGGIGNSVWQVVEASSQQEPLTRALHELVLRLNNEDVLTEGLMKFNSFIFGLLNVRGLDTWFSYLRTRESVLRKHYLDTGILLSSSRGIMSDRQLTDHLLNLLKPLADLSFRLDLLHECRQLHRSLMQLEQNSPVQSGGNRTSWVLKKIVRSLQNVTETVKEDESNEIKNSTSRPRSCVDSSNGFTFNDITTSMKKRWSGIQFGSKLASAFERLGVEDEDETYSDSLDPTVNNTNTLADNIKDETCSNADADLALMPNENLKSEKENEDRYSSTKRELKFKQLQKKWEMLAEKQSPEGLLSPRDTYAIKNMDDSSSVSSGKSRIPRPVTSPVRLPSSLHFTLSNNKTSIPLRRPSPTSPNSIIPLPVSRKTISPTGIKRITDSDPVKTNRPKSATVNRSSRADQNVPSSHPSRPSSLPQKLTRDQKSKIMDDRKRPSSSSRYSNTMSKYVRTLGHHLPSDNGHLSFNEGEKLRIVLEVDDKWILCCRGNQKGLVPRSAVLPISGHL